MANNTADKTPLNLPAPYVNQLQTLVAGTNIRVAFGESGPEGTRVYRSAVVMATGDALELVTQLLAAMQEINPLPPAAGLFGTAPMGAVREENHLPGGILGALGNKPNG